MLSLLFDRIIYQVNVYLAIIYYFTFKIVFVNRKIRTILYKFNKVLEIIYILQISIIYYVILTYI